MVTIKEIIQFLKADPDWVYVYDGYVEIHGVTALDHTEPLKLSFCTSAEQLSKITSVIEGLVLMPKSMGKPDVTPFDCIYVNNPRETFIRVCHEFFPEIRDYDRNFVQTHGVVNIHESAQIGFAGFGFERTADGSCLRFPHYGKVIIEDDVEIGPNTCIARGALGNTIIHKGVKIDSLCHIAHNVEIGEHTLIVSHAMIGGSVKIGKRCFIGGGAIIRDHITIGDDAFIGLGAVVVHDVPAKTTVIGNPARPYIKK